MLAFYRKYWRTAFDVGVIALTVYLVMFVFSHLYAIAAPIFLALIIFWIIEPLAAFLNRRGIKKVFSSGISIMLFVLIIIGVLVGAGVIVFFQVSNIMEMLPKYSKLLTDSSNELVTFLVKEYNALPPETLTKVNEYISKFAGEAVNWIKTFFDWILVNLTSFSTFIFNFAIAIVLAYFLSSEIGMWRQVAHDKTPRTFKTAFHFLKNNVFRGLGIYLKAQLKLITVTFTLTFISLLLLGVDSAFTIALFAALFDILPVLGVPVIFVPWAIYSFIVGNTFMGIMLLVVLVIVMATRQILEPKITGNSLGVSAFTMLSFMIISLSLFGVAGLILSPILLILVKALFDQGYLQSWIRMPQEEFESNPLSPPVSQPKHTDSGDKRTT